MMKSDSGEVDTRGQRARLLKLLVDRFNLGELKTLCFKLGVPYDDLSSENTVSGKARELIVYMARRGRLDDLLQALKQERPTVSWPSLSQLQAGEKATTPSSAAVTKDKDVVRNAVWNALYKSLWTKRTFLNPHKKQPPLIDKFSARVWAECFKKPIDSRPSDRELVLQEIRDYFFSCSEDEFYRYLEFILNYWNELRHYKPEPINQAVNSALKREGTNLRYRPQYDYNRFVTGAIVETIHSQSSVTTAAGQSHIPSSEVPDDILGIIRERGEKRFPNDFSTRKYFIDKEVQAWRSLQAYQAPDVPEDILATIFEQAENQFPDDFSTRLYRIDKEVEAWRSLHN